jgi:hypothetical protein
MLRDPDKKGQHERSGRAPSVSNVDQLEFASRVNYLNAEAIQMCEMMIQRVWSGSGARLSTNAGSSKTTRVD